MVDTPQTLAAALARAASTAVAAVQPVVSKGAATVKNEARRNSQVSSGKAARHAPKTITYDVTSTPVSVGAQIGYDKDLGGQAPLGNILEYGSPNSPPHRDLGRALDDEDPKFVAALAVAIGKLL